MSSDRRTWKLNSFLDSLTLELDKAQDTLSVKGLNRRLTYTVKDMSLELALFPDFDGQDLRFALAKPGESGAAKIAFQLGSITDRQIREVANEPATADDVSIEKLEGLDEETKHTLQKIGVKSAKDLERMESKNIDLQQVAKKSLDYKDLAGLIQRARRQQAAPAVSRASLTKSPAGPVLTLQGKNLSTGNSLEGFPRAFLNGEPVEILAASAAEIRLALKDRPPPDRAHALQVVLDPYAIVNMEIRS